MTMQVALVGSDGIVLASDTKWTVSEQYPRRSFEASKIKIDYERCIAVSYARNMETSGAIADALLRLPDGCWQSPITPIEQAARSILELAPRKEAHCLIVSARPSLQLLLFEVATVNGVPDQPMCQPIGDKCCAGDNANAAWFLAERYYERIPVAQLIPLAAQIIVAAAKLNSGAISGLEIVECKPDCFRRLSAESALELEAKAIRVDKSLGRSLSAHQQFAYAPAAGR